MKETTRRLGVLGLFVGGVLLLGPTPTRAGHEAFATYEDWTTAPTIRSDRWVGTSDLGHERLRKVKEDKLLMRFRREGGGPPGFFSNRLGFVNPSSVDQVEAEFKVRRLTVNGCDATSSTARAVAIDLNKLNDGAGGPGLTGDHFGRVLAFRRSDSTDPANTLTVQALVLRCDNAPCSIATNVSGPVTLGQVQIKKKFRLRLVWDAPNAQFLAGLNDDPNVSLPYLPGPNAPPANVPFAFIRIQHLPAPCTEASGDAEIEVREVSTNQSAVIP